VLALIGYPRAFLRSRVARQYKSGVVMKNVVRIEAFTQKLRVSFTAVSPSE